MDMNKKTRTRSNNNGIGPPRLPEEIMLYNILTRVPAKSLNRFRCVCKQWSNLLVDDPLFKSLYSHYNNSSYKERGFICYESFLGEMRGKETTYSFSVVDIDNKVSRKIPFRPPEEVFSDSQEGVSLDIQHSLSGLLLLRFQAGWAEICTLYVYNPASGFWMHVRSNVKMDRYTKRCYLAYDPTISKYKVVKLHEEERFDILTVDEHSGSSNPWRRVRIPSNYTCIDDKHTYVNCKPVFLKHALHWICTRNKRNRSDNSVQSYGEILRLDVSKDKLSRIKLPVKKSSASGRLLEMGGLLWFIDSVQHNVLKLWYLKKKKKYGIDEWVVKCSISLVTNIDAVDKMLSSEIGGCSWKREPCVIVMDPKCKIIFTFGCHTRYVCSYDMELKHWDLIHAGSGFYKEKNGDPGDIPRFHSLDFHYWNGNKNALST